ncbi:hypothetical protein F0562_003906 [Nyssa sinensis]|uniref:Uncharacterized protein n=1 Tax=Nyssa sinensis TaxID=561372 RepID=A0A5J5BZC2_9ASTE|nr:hypothetical protein F0562_003906 [Nyssa sinensis]
MHSCKVARNGLAEDCQVRLRMDIGKCQFGLARKRITIPEIKNLEWFLKNLPADLMGEKMMSNQFEEHDQPMQSIDEIMQIISEATIPPVSLYDLDMDDDMDDLDSDLELDVDSSGEVINAI